MNLPVSFKSLGERMILIEWPSRTIEESVFEQVIAWKTAIELQLGDVITECIPAYISLGIAFDPQLISATRLTEKIQSLNIDLEVKPKVKKWQLPVCYDESLAVDLADFCQVKKISIEELIEIHSHRTYLLHFYGFLPGFMYLGGLTNKLHHPRKATPSRRIEAGSVAIGGSQTGIYPISSPGGWHIIGSCPVTIFDPRSTPPVSMSAGDVITFKPVDIATYHEIKRESKTGNYHLQYQAYEG